MAGFLGDGVPVYDIAKFYRPQDKRDLLVRNIPLGESLAVLFGSRLDAEPEHAAVLMRGHGFTVQGSSIMDAVMRAVYTQQNALIQTTALLTHSAHFRAPLGEQSQDDQDMDPESSEPTYLTKEEAADATEMTLWSGGRPWRLWLREVESQSLYVNMA